MARAHAGYAAALIRLERTAEGIASYREALRLEPDYLRVYQQIAGVYLQTGCVREAVECFDRAAALDPDPDWLSNYLYAIHFDETRSPHSIFAAHREWQRRYGAATVCPASPGTDVPLRVGYVSGDFRAHPVAFFFEPVLAGHRRGAFEITCYDNTEEPDRTSERLRGLADCWRGIRGVSDAEAEALIRRDGIHILVDLSGHTGDNRLSLFARKPAPVQATWLGYPNTTGLRAIDYRITDAVADPPGAESLHSERLIRLPRCFLCFDRPRSAPEVAPLPAVANGFVTFGSFSKPAKWNAEVVRAWSAILSGVPRSRLLLHHATGLLDFTRSRVLAAFDAHGIGAARVQFAGSLPAHRHFALYHEVDLALDPFPYNGTTAVCEALWMGVPVVALEGASHISRVAASLLASAGLDGFTATTPAAYVDLAVRHARNAAQLASLRSGLRGLIRKSPLMDVSGFVEALENAYRAMWRCCRMEPGKTDR